MNRICLTLLFMLSFASVVSAQPTKNCNVTIPNEQGASFQDIIIGSTAVTVLASNGLRCAALILETSGNPVRCIGIGFPGVDVTASVGTPLENGSTLAGLILDLSNGVKNEWRCIRKDAVDGTIHVVEWRE